MTKNQFFYSYKTEKGEDVVGSFNVEYVIRTFSTKDGGIMVLLDDGHEESVEMPVQKSKNNISYEKRRTYLMSQIELNAEDTKRFIAISSIDNYQQ